MMLGQAFLDAVAPLASPRMGTEVMAPLLHQLVRFTRPSLVLEVGMGYTTPFLLQALADNEADDLAAKDALLRKASILSDPTGADGRGGFEGKAFARLPKQERLAWLEAEPSLADPRFYEQARTPRLIAIDDFSSPHTSAAVQAERLAELGLARLLEPVAGEFRGRAEEIVSRFGLLDFIWFDCGGYQEYVDFLDEYWPVLKPGGLLAMHYTLTNLSMGTAVKDFRTRELSRYPDAEIVSLLEPHKMMQNSFTLIRKITNYRDRIYLEVRDISLERD